MRILGLLACLLLWGGAVEVRAEFLIVPGTGDSQLLLRELAATYNQNSNTTVVVPDSIGSSGGLRRVDRGQARLARVARRLTDKEESVGLQWRQFAYAPVVFACHEDLPRLDNLTSEQVRQVFTGQIQTWSELGAGEGKIYVAQREKGDSSRTVLTRHFPIFADTDSLVGEILYTTPEMVETLSRHERTIGYLPLSSAKNAGIRPLALDGVEATEENLQRGDYPLVIPLAVAWKGELDPVTADFVRYLFSGEAKTLMRSFGVVPTKEN